MNTIISGLRILTIGFLLISYAIVFAEFFLRFVSPVAIMPRYVTGGDDGIRMNIPDAIYRQKTQEVNVEIRINKQGLRADKHFTEEKPHGICRVAVFGDSFFLGYEAEIEHSFSSILESGLQDAGYPCEVLNFSVSGFGTAESLIALSSRAIQFHPDLVIFELHDTDLSENQRSGLFRLNDGVLVRNKKSYLPAINIRDKLMQYSVYQWLIQNSQLYSAIREKAALQVKKILLKLRKLSSSPGKPMKKEVKINKEPTSSAQLLVALLEAAKQQASENNAQFLLVEIPDAYSRPNYYSMLEKELRNFNLRNHFVIATPRDEFLKPGNENSLFFYETGHKHLSILGNKIVADYTLREIIENKLLADFRSLQ